MKYIFLDDCRKEPSGWHRTYTVEQTIELLENVEERVEVISLDNDLGYQLTEGYKVARWIEEKAHEAQYNPAFFLKYIPKKVIVHTANSRAASEMIRSIRAANRFMLNVNLEPIEVIRPRYTPHEYVYDQPGNDWEIEN